MTAWRQQINNHVIEPTSIRGLSNGAFPAAALHAIHDHTGTIVGRLCPEAARSWDAMVDAAWAEGVALLPTSSADTFRSLAVQQSIFTDRYRTTDQGNGSRTCGGKRWYLRKGKATAACPGTSNHGRGLAVDFRRPTPNVLAWMERNAGRFGWQWELASEEWHVHYMPGDKTPQAVLDHQAVSTQDATHAQLFQEDNMLRLLQCNPDRNEWPQIKGHWFKSDGLTAVHVPTKGHATALLGLGLLKEDSPVLVSPNLLRELGATPPAA